MFKWQMPKILKGVLHGGSKKRVRNQKDQVEDSTQMKILDTVKIKFATPADARATVAKVKRINKPFAEKYKY